MTESRTARLITDTLAPANLVIAILLIIGWHSASSVTGLGWGVLAALFCGGIPFAVIMLGVKRGHWTDKHIRVREQRAVPLLATTASVLIGISLLVALGAPRQVFALVVAMLVGLIVTMIVTVWWKVSVHTAVAGGVVVILLLAYGMSMAPLMLGVAAIGWSRVALRDHTPAQTVVGALLGGLAAAVVFSLMR
ncbi:MULTISPECIES: phosphatase PAP2 family protein [Streptomyces]|uniref:phosphatase PAP2 family protein n=1 Tax=Streptomyces TaxID=1883 RepID=UPI0029A97CDF|nr:phosphatase PAP2 family protein [Streptomyces europaeiscabiei]MDX2525186.1 phosphatase PAP2 family protein [Streptomyces europaeiscabiei]